MRRVPWSRALEELLTPHGLLLAGFLVSGLAWLVPGESTYLRGFDQRAEVSFGGIVVLVAFYAVCAAVAWACVHYTRRFLVPHTDRWLSDDNASVDSRVLYILTVLAATGVGYVLIRAGGPLAFLDAVARSQANVLKDATGDGVGVATLRYTTTIAAPIAVHRLFRHRRGVVLAIVNVALLMITAIVASRLSLIMAVVVGIFLFVRTPARVRGGWWWIGGAGGLVALAMVFLNNARNAGFYADHGVPNPFASAFYQALTYLGTPFQVSAGVATAFIERPSTFVDGARGQIWSVLLPSFLAPDVTARPLDVPRYHGVVDVNGALTTNSVFADVLYVYGPVGFIAVIAWVILISVLFGLLERSRGYALAAAGVALYTFAEFWRIFLMNQGIALYAMGITVAAVALATGLTRNASANASLERVRL